MLQYHSPARLLESLGERLDSFRAQDLPKLQKRLLLELDLAEDTTIKLGDQEYDRQGILDLMSQLGGALENLPMHQKIASQRGLLELLDQGKIGQGIPPISEAFLAQEVDQEFITFVSPYLAVILERHLVRTFVRRQFAQGVWLLSLQPLLTAVDTLQVFGKVGKAMDNDIRDMHLARLQADSFDETQWLHWQEVSWVQWLNTLPPAMDAVREQYIRSVINLSHDCLRTYRALYKKLYDRFIQLERVPEEVWEVIINNWQVANQSLIQGRSSQGRTLKRYMMITIGGLFLLRVIFLLFGIDG